MIWGLVLQKARNGMTVSNTKESSTISSAVTKAGGLICLIIGATALQFMANYQTPVQTAAPASPSSQLLDLETVPLSFRDHLLRLNSTRMLRPHLPLLGLLQLSDSASTSS